ncbi:MAG TPA: aromatic aminobenezylarsenical efflux permease ArsG family transporter [Candidatus Krumholzibacteria bacterium]
MSEQLLAIGTAIWLGFLTSISPCPLASNIAAVSFVARQVGSPRRAVLAGIAYALGRALTYVLVAILVVSSLLSIPGLSFFLQERMNQVIGPLLILAGIVLLGWLKLPLLGAGVAARGTSRRGGILGAGVLGIMFALSFCPVSAGLFFGGLIPLAIQTGSRIVLPSVFGIGTGLPVVFFAVLIAVGAHHVGRAFEKMAVVERAARRVTGIVFVLCGVYLVATHLLGVNLR